MATKGIFFGENAYFPNLMESFLVGGTTPIEALFGITDEDSEDLNSASDYIDYFSDYGWNNYFPDAPDVELGSSVSSSDVVSDADTALNYISDEVNTAVENQNAASQASADRAMEFEKAQAELNRQFQAEQAQKAMDYQTQMSNTAYQRAMADLQAAGINPKLVGKLGAASTPAGVAATGDSASGYVANMSMANISALAGVLESYNTSAASLTNKDKDFVQSIIVALISLMK